jgi:putative ABC transport system permease protein
MSTILSDLRFALRILRRSPLFASVAILSLAMGIGSNTAIFTLMDQIVLRKLPIKDPDSLVMLYQTASNNGNNMGRRMQSYPIYQDFQQKAAPLSEVICRRLISTSLSVDNQTERVDAEMVSGNFFSMLGVGPAAGRVFSSEEDDRVYQGHPAVVLSYPYWVRRFSRDSNVVGKKILVNNYPMTIVGVSAQGFMGLDPTRSPQIRVPILMKQVIAPEWKWLQVDDRRSRWVQVFARLKPGYTVESAAAPLQGLFHQIREYEMTLPAAAKWSAYSRGEFMKGTIHIEKAATGYSDLRNSFSTALMVLMIMVGLVLLIACANVANLLIARALARQKEVSVRLSLGASRGQLVRQLLMESMVLAGAGGVIGILLAFTMTRGLLALIPAEGNPLQIVAMPDIRILLFTLGVTLLTGLVFGLIPAWRATRPDLWTTLKDTIGSIAGTRGSSLFLRKSLIAVQVALSFLLLFGAGLFVRSLQNLKTTSTGFEGMENLVTFQVSPALNGYDVPRAVNFYRQLLDSTRAMPGVKDAAFAAVALLHGDEWDRETMVEGHEAKDGENMQAYMNATSPGYFRTMGIPILEGRDFDDRDLHPDSKTAIVNEHFAKHFFGEVNPIGRHLGNNGPQGKLDTEIVGVVADSLYEGPRQGVRRQVFIPIYGNGSNTFYVRTTSDSRTAYAAIRRAVKNLDASLPVYEMKTLESQLDETLLTERLIALLSAGFGLLATTLAVIGLYGVMAFVVTRRTKEMGVRLALGAPRRNVIWLVMREVLILVATGLAVGVPSAIGLGRFVSAQLYGIQGTDLRIAAAMVFLLSAVAAAAGMIPAHRASRIDPMTALRFE